MEIIKRGKIDTEIKRFECKKCGTIFECDFHEYHPRSRFDTSQGDRFWDGTLKNYWHHCPVCLWVCWSD